MNSADIVRYLLAAVLGLVFVVMASANIWMKVRSYRTGKFISVIPLIGGLAGLLAMLIVPLDLWRWCWLPIVIDPGTSLLIVALPVIVWHELRRGPQGNGGDSPSNGDRETHS